MGNCCQIFKTKDLNSTQVDSNGNIIKKCGEKEIFFWQELENLKLIKISSLDKLTKTVIFNYSDLFLENFISISQIMEYMIVEQNFFYFLPLFEITIAIIDFIKVIFLLKRKYDLNKNSFFFLNFEKFFLMKGEDGYYSKLVYLDDKINDNYSCAEILYKEESNNLLSSFSIMEDNTRSMQNLISNIKSNNNTKVYKASVAIDLNSYFYSNCNERYQKLRNDYNLDNCEIFYTENILTFITKFLLKKIVFCNQQIEREFNNFKFIFRHSIKSYFNTQSDKSNTSNINSEFMINTSNVSNINFSSSSNLYLDNLKVLLSNFYLNNFEFGTFRNSLEELLITKNRTSNISDHILNEKIISFLRCELNLNYGECDIINANIPKTFHKISFISDKISMSKFSNKNRKNSLNLSSSYNNLIGQPQDTSICINCSKNLVYKKCPESFSNNFSIVTLRNELYKSYEFFDFSNFIKYLCLFFQSKDPLNTIKDIFEEKGKEIMVFQKNKYCLLFQYIHWDDYQEQVLIDEILNFDYIVKNMTNKRKNSQHERTSIMPSGMRVSDTNNINDKK